MNRHAKSYFPLLYHIAQTEHSIRVQNRPGNVHDGKSQALSMIKETIRRLQQQFPSAVTEARLDSAFFREDILKFFLGEGIEFAIRVPMWKWLGLKEIIQERKRWFHPKPRLASFSKHVYIEAWGMELPLYFFRHKLSDKSPKGHQLDFFTPNDGIYEYSPQWLLTFSGFFSDNLYRQENQEKMT